jgi:uracil-DNA glycosylase, family 4
MNSLEELANQISSCMKCELCRYRINAVPGEGKENARIMLIGEAPGKNEDITGRPFVGRAGALLDGAFKEASLSRSELFITNVVKCRPPGNRKPKAAEIEACRKHLLQQIKIVKPEVIVTLGLTALQFFKDAERIQELPFEYGDERIKVYPTYHPAAALRGNKVARESLYRTIKAAKDYTDSKHPLNSQTQPE